MYLQISVQIYFKSLLKGDYFFYAETPEALNYHFFPMSWDSSLYYALVRSVASKEAKKVKWALTSFPSFIKKKLFVRKLF